MNIDGTLHNYGGVYNGAYIQNGYNATLINHPGATFENRSDDSSRYCGFFINWNKIENFGTFKTAKMFDNAGTFLNHSTLTNESGGTFTNNGTLDTTGGPTVRSTLLMSGSRRPITWALRRA